MDYDTFVISSLCPDGSYQLKYQTVTAVTRAVTLGHIQTKETGMCWHMKGKNS